MDIWFQGFSLALNGMNVLWLLLGAALGLVVGVLPALGPTFGVALMLPFTFSLDPVTALIFLCAIHGACNYGDSFSSIMLNIPGGPGTVATCWDGYPLAKQGFAGRALGIATFSSVFGGVASWISLLLLAGAVTTIAFSMGAPEYFALGLMALSLISLGSRGETIKGLIMACMGLALSFIGPDPVTGLTNRFGFGIVFLEAGIPTVVTALAVFAVAQIIVMMNEGGSITEVIELSDSVVKGFLDVIRRPLTLLRSGLLGWFIGIMPAMGVGLAGISCYFFEKKYSREANRFGHGEPAGLIAAEMGKGACVVGDLIPTFTLGIPGSATGAILMAALIIHGIEPGPRFLSRGAEPYAVFASLLLVQVLYIPISILLGRWLVKIVYLPNALIAPVIAVLCFLGAYAERNLAFDILLMLGLGVSAYILVRLQYPVVCLVLGLILGPLIEANYHRSIDIGFGSASVFVTRPITLLLLIVTFFFMAWPFASGIIGWVRLRRKKAKKEPTGQEMGDDGKEKSTWSEILVLFVLGILFSVFLGVCQSYGPSVKAFPDLVCSVGLALVLVLFGKTLIVGLRHHRFGFLAFRVRGPSFSGMLGPWWSVGLMLFTYGFMQLFGLAIASGIFVVATALMMGYRRRLVTVVVAVVVAISMIVLAKIAGILLPSGMLGD